MLWCFLLECDPNNSLGGSPFRDQLNIYTHLPGGKRQVYCLNTVTLDKRYRSKYNSEDTQFVFSHEIYSIWDKMISQLSDGDTILWLLTGHGYQTRDLNFDEEDGFDEFVYIRQGEKLLDDRIKRMITLIPPTVRFIGLADTCHSGTMFDFDHKFNNSSWDERGKRGTPNCYSLGACSDYQLDHCDIGNVAGYGGALTVHLLDYPDSISKLINGNETAIMSIYHHIQKTFVKLHQYPTLECYNSRPILRGNKDTSGLFSFIPICSWLNYN